MNLTLFKTLFPRASKDVIKANTSPNQDLSRYKKGDVVYDARTKKYLRCIGGTKDSTNEDHINSKLPRSIPEQNARKALERPSQRQNESSPSVTLRIVGFSCRPLDPDNFCGGAKHLIDSIRAAGLINDDSPEHITLITEQVKVAHRGEERTQIVIEFP